MTSGDTAGLDQSRLTETAQHRLTAVLDDLPVAWQTELLDALGQVESTTLERWLHGHHLHSWVEHGSRGLTVDRGKNEHLASAFFSGHPTGLTRAEPGRPERVVPPGV
jgi:hypothetical protein